MHNSSNSRSSIRILTLNKRLTSAALNELHDGHTIRGHNLPATPFAVKSTRSNGFKTLHSSGSALTTFVLGLVNHPKMFYSLGRERAASFTGPIG